MSIKKTLSYNIYRKNHKTEDQRKVELHISSDNPVYTVHRSLIKQIAAKRQGTASTKTRSEVRGGGKKPWKQKGTGKARAGSIRSPLWRGGGVVFGPKPKTYKLKLNNKEKQLALRNLIYDKIDSTILINEDELNLHIPKTKEVLNKLLSLGIQQNHRTLIIVDKKLTNLYLGTRNLCCVELIQANHLNIRSILNAQYIILTEQSLKTINKTYNA
uniref:Large ribosomal subunit protein uL4c n=1 Tax=Titanophycus setchellii TaxID=940129 RepID=A0A1G4NYD6_9FLOR|nr:Ribosomal protein L4 [Titanophycus setchellii]SCW23634.1 Ribosomal protein L4 [Titanophycus setchellii]